MAVQRWQGGEARGLSQAASGTATWYISGLGYWAKPINVTVGIPLAFTIAFLGIYPTDTFAHM